MTARQVSLEFLLVGKSHRSTQNKFSLESSKDIESCMVSQIHETFGDRPLYMPHRVEQAAERQEYPDFFAAGWFVSNEPVGEANNIGSELVVIEHGSSLKSAKKNLMETVSTAPWDEQAADIK